MRVGAGGWEVRGVQLQSAVFACSSGMTWVCAGGFALSWGAVSV